MGGLGVFFLLKRCTVLVSHTLNFRDRYMSRFYFLNARGVAVVAVVEPSDIWLNETFTPECEETRNNQTAVQQ